MKVQGEHFHFSGDTEFIYAKSNICPDGYQTVKILFVKNVNLLNL